MMRSTCLFQPTLLLLFDSTRWESIIFMSLRVGKDPDSNYSAIYQLGNLQET